MFNLTIFTRKDVQSDYVDYPIEKLKLKHFISITEHYAFTKENKIRFYIFKENDQVKIILNPYKPGDNSIFPEEQLKSELLEYLI